VTGGDQMIRLKARVHLPLAFVLAASLGLAGQGCGLAEYEAKMQFQQDRLNYAERENRFLESESLQLPATMEDDNEVIPATHFFCRPPRDIEPVPSEAKLGNILHIFRARGLQSALREMMVGMVKTDGSSRFIEDVLSVLGCQGAARSFVDLSPPGRPALHLERYEEEQPDEVTQVYFYRDGPYEAAVVFKLSPSGAQQSGMQEAIKYSLGSLRTGNLASEMVRVYKPPPPPALTPGQESMQDAAQRIKALKRR
jgi:hypothetical protein